MWRKGAMRHVLPGQNLEIFLLNEIKRTREAYDKTRIGFSAVSSDIPSGIPHPDGTTRIKNARRDNSAALEEYMRALREFNDFIISRKVPDRFKGITR
jgi:hypothetical protein